MPPRILSITYKDSENLRFDGERIHRTTTMGHQAGEDAFEAKTRAIRCAVLVPSPEASRAAPRPHRPVGVSIDPWARGYACTAESSLHVYCVRGATRCGSGPPRREDPVVDQESAPRHMIRDAPKVRNRRRPESSVFLGIVAACGRAGLSQLRGSHLACDLVGRAYSIASTGRLSNLVRVRLNDRMVAVRVPYATSCSRSPARWGSDSNRVATKIRTGRRRPCPAIRDGPRVPVALVPTVITMRRSSMC